MKIRQLYSSEEIAARVSTLGRQISEYYQDRPFTVIFMLNGAIFFGADLVRALPCSARLFLDSLAASSYVNDQSTGVVKVRSKLKLPLQDREILLIDDILDSGVSLQSVTKYLMDGGAKEVRTCVLLDKEVPHTGLTAADWYGFRIPDLYVVGYGLDSEERYRHLSFIGYME